MGLSLKLRFRGFMTACGLSLNIILTLHVILNAQASCPGVYVGLGFGWYLGLSAEGLGPCLGCNESWPCLQICKSL